jgi:hypothetical protein
MTSLQNNLLVETIENLSKEIDVMQTIVNSFSTNVKQPQLKKQPNQVFCQDPSSLAKPPFVQLHSLLSKRKIIGHYYYYIFL